VILVPTTSHIAYQLDPHRLRFYLKPRKSPSPRLHLHVLYKPLSHRLQPAMPPQEGV
jgi:hypothetical protein